MKLFVENFNGVLDVVIDTLAKSGRLTDNPHEADAFLLWQDVRGTLEYLASVAKHALKKPVFVMQHGRGAVRDYGPPNNFKLIADKIFVWGKSEERRLLSYGIEQDKIVVTGCPLFPRLKAGSKERSGKNVLFVPVIAEKEEPENLLVYAALKEWESQKLIGTIYKYFDQLKKAWAHEYSEFKNVECPDGKSEKRLWKKQVIKALPRYVTYEAGLLNVKLTPVHDVHQYQAPLVLNQQNEPDFIEGICALLANIDVMVCLEEGTMQLLAHKMGIPVILVDIFKYGTYGGCEKYDSIEKITTKATYITSNIRKLGSIVDHVLANPREKDKQRAIVCEDEGGTSLGDANDNVVRFIEHCLGEQKRTETKEVATV